MRILFFKNKDIEHCIFIRVQHRGKLKVIQEFLVSEELPIILNPSLSLQEARIYLLPKEMSDVQDGYDVSKNVPDHEIKNLFLQRAKEIAKTNIQIDIFEEAKDEHNV